MGFSCAGFDDINFFASRKEHFDKHLKEKTKDDLFLDYVRDLVLVDESLDVTNEQMEREYSLLSSSNDAPVLEENVDTVFGVLQRELERYQNGAVVTAVYKKHICVLPNVMEKLERLIKKNRTRIARCNEHPHQEHAAVSVTVVVASAEDRSSNKRAMITRSKSKGLSVEHMRPSWTCEDVNQQENDRPQKRLKASDEFKGPTQHLVNVHAPESSLAKNGKIVSYVALGSFNDNVPMVVERYVQFFPTRCHGRTVNRKKCRRWAERGKQFCKLHRQS